MPRYTKEASREFFQRANSGVMANYRGNVVLSSKNLISNPDLKDFDHADDIEGWTLDAPDRPTGWNVYARQLTRTGTGSIRDRTAAEKQNFDDLSMHNEQFTIGDKLESGAPLPDSGKRALIAPPDHIKVKVKSGGAAGYRAGTYYLSYAYILGPKNPGQSHRISNTAPVISVTLTQGQRIKLYLPDAPGDGVVGYAIYMSDRNGTANALYEQERVDLRNRTPESITLRGPLKIRGKLANNPTGTNNTKLGNMGAPKKWTHHNKIGSKLIVDKRCAVAYRVLTQEGWSQVSAYQEVPQRNYGEVDFRWRPRNFPHGAIAWLPLFRAENGDWYTLRGRYYDEDGIAVKRYASIPTFKINGIKDSKKGDDKDKKDSNPQSQDVISKEWNKHHIHPVKASLDVVDKDQSGIEAPDSPLDDPDILGTPQLTPGKYRIRTTFSLDDQESGPSPYKDVTLAETSSGSGVTNDTIHVYRPHIQRITNDLWSRTDLSGIRDDWDEPDVHGTTVTYNNGQLKVVDTTSAATDIIIKRSDDVEINPARFYTFRAHMNVTRYVTGLAQIGLHFYNASGTEIDSVMVGRVHSASADNLFRVSFSNDRTKSPDVRIPATAATMKVTIRSTGNVFGVRNMDFTVDQIGLFAGAVNRKRVPGLDLGLQNDRDVLPKKSVAAEDTDTHYPVGAFSRIVEAPTDGPRILDPTILARENFEGGTRNGAFTVVTGAGTQTVERGGSINGEYGLNITTTSSTGSYIQYNFTSRTRAACSTWFRIHTTPTSSTRILTANDSSANVIGRVDVATDGLISLTALNGAGTSSINIGRYLRRGVKTRIEMEVQGAGTASGRVDIYVKRGDNTLETYSLTSLNLSTAGQVDRFRAGNITGQGNDLDIDDMIVTADGIHDTNALVTNYAEYYAQEGQPYVFKTFMYGMSVPVKGGSNYTISMYAGCENVLRDKPAELFYSVFRDIDGNVVGHNDPIVTLRGDNHWERYSSTVTAPADAVELEFTGNRIAEGFIRAGAFQVEKGSTLTAWDRSNGTTGYFDVVFDTKVPGKPIADMIQQIVSYVGGNAAVTHEWDTNLNDITSHSIQWRGGTDYTALDAASYTTLSAATASYPRYVEIRVTLTTPDTTKSPEVHAVTLNTERALPMLYSDTGEDFDGGALVRNMSAVHKVRNAIDREYADGGKGFAEVGRSGPSHTAYNIEIEVDSDKAVEQITNACGRGDGEFMIEARDMRYIVTFKMPTFQVNRSNVITSNNQAALDGRKYLYRHIATGIVVDVVEDVSLG